MPRRSPRHVAVSHAPAALDNVGEARRHPRPGTFPAVSTIPTTPLGRLAWAAVDANAPGSDTSLAPDTVLYLAYGSNMAASTFLGARGIRPLSRINVSVASLRLTFDLPGAPYWEPCFANVAPKDHAEKSAAAFDDRNWDGRLIGIVYEVTSKDWRRIMQTEGGGSSYQEIEVACEAITPEKPPVGAFLARTLCYSPAGPDGSLVRGRWSCMVSGTQRSLPAQPSARYLKLLSTGAEEHQLPASYQHHLASLQPYTVTHWRQWLGGRIFVFTWGPLLIVLLKAAGFLADDRGSLPLRVAAGINLMMNIMWKSYDVLFKPVFGDGERIEREGPEPAPEKQALLRDGKAQ